MSMHIELRETSPTPCCRRVIRCDMCRKELSEIPTLPGDTFGDIHPYSAKCEVCAGIVGPPKNILQKKIEAQKPQQIPAKVFAGPDGNPLENTPTDHGTTGTNVYQDLLFDLLEHIDPTMFEEPDDSESMVRYAKELITSGKNKINGQAELIRRLEIEREETFKDLDAAKMKNRKLERELARWSDGIATLPSEIYARAQKMGKERNWKDGGFYLTNALDAVERLEKEREELIKKNQGAFDTVEVAVTERDKLREELAAANARVDGLIGGNGRDYCTKIEKERDSLKMDLAGARKAREYLEKKLIDIGSILQGDAP